MDIFACYFYKRSTSGLGTHTDWKWEDGKKVFHANGNQKNAGVAILISNKLKFKDCQKRQGRTPHNSQGISLKRRHINYKYICTLHRCTSIYKANAKGGSDSNTIIVEDFNPT